MSQTIDGLLGVGACLKECNNPANWAVATETQTFNDNITTDNLKGKLPSKKTEAIRKLSEDLVDAAKGHTLKGGKRRRTRKSNKKKKSKKSKSKKMKSIKKRRPTRKRRARKLSRAR